MSPAASTDCCYCGSSQVEPEVLRKVSYSEYSSSGSDYSENSSDNSSSASSGRSTVVSESTKSDQMAASDVVKMESLLAKYIRATMIEDPNSRKTIQFSDPNPISNA